MTLQEKYLNKITSSLGNGRPIETKSMNGGTAYIFPCPFCSHIRTSSGKDKPFKKTAILSPLTDCKYEYYFKCHRGYSPECKGGPRNFLNFLIMYRPYLAEKYKAEKNDYSHLTFDKPEFNNDSTL